MKQGTAMKVEINKSKGTKILHESKLKINESLEFQKKSHVQMHQII